MRNNEGLECEHTTKDGIIQNPGKFEGCYYAAPHFYDSCLEQGHTAELVFGDEEESQILASYFVISAEEAKQYGLEENEILELWEDDNGFVYISTKTQDEFIKYIENILSNSGHSLCGNLTKKIDQYIEENNLNV